MTEEEGEPEAQTAATLFFFTDVRKKKNSCNSSYLLRS
jgi:hypothetical protein